MPSEPTIASAIPSEEASWWIDRNGLQELIDRLIEIGYEVVGPKIDQGAIVYDQLASADELPRGWTDEQGPGLYRLHRRDDDELFGYNVGPHSWKNYLFHP